MDFVIDSLGQRPACVKRLTVADDFSHEAAAFAVNYGISWQ